MAIDQTRAKITADIWRAIAQSRVDLSAIPTAQQQELVGRIAESLMLTLNDLMDEAVDEAADEAPLSAAADEEVDENAEKIMWKGRPFLSLVEQYTITNERLKITRGMVARRVENFELIRIQDIDFKQNMSERVFGLGDITIRGSDASQPLIVLRNIHDPEKVYEILRRTWLEARKRHGLQFREYM